MKWILIWSAAAKKRHYFWNLFLHKHEFPVLRHRLDAVAWLDGIAFWSLAAEIGDVALDASPLTLEHLSAGRFHVVLRYSNEDGVEDVERRLLSLAGLWCLPPEVQCHP